MSDRSTINALLDSIERYFDLMFDNDVSRFEHVFAPTAQLHGLRDGALRLLPSADYRSALASRESPQSKRAPRLQEILSLDFASPTQALAKVRVRIDQNLYLDYLAFHLVDGRWLVTAKSFHVERNFAEAMPDSSRRQRARNARSNPQHRRGPRQLHAQYRGIVG